MNKESDNQGLEYWKKLRIKWNSNSSKNQQNYEEKDSEKSFSSVNSLEEIKEIKKIIKSKGPHKPFSQRQKLSNIVDICEELWEDEIYD